MSELELVSVVVRDYDEAIAFFVGVLDFELAEDSASKTNDGRAKRWVIVRPRGGRTGLLLARADGPLQESVVGAQFAGRVGLFLRVDDFEKTIARMKAARVEFIGEPREEPYGRVVVFKDLWGNRWDLLGPRPQLQSSQHHAVCTDDEEPFVIDDRGFERCRRHVGRDF